MGMYEGCDAAIYLFCEHSGSSFSPEANVERSREMRQVWSPKNTLTFLSDQQKPACFAPATLAEFRLDHRASYGVERNCVTLVHALTAVGIDPIGDVSSDENLMPPLLKPPPTPRTTKPTTVRRPKISHSQGLAAHAVSSP